MGIFSKKTGLAKTHDFCAAGTGAEKLTVVLIHGLASDSGTFTRALQFLEGTTSLKEIRFVAFDLLGSGKSPAGEKYDYKEQVEALHEAIEGLKLMTPLVLVGHSMGTLIATRYADTYKKSVARLILISPPVYTPEDLVSPAFAAGIKMFEKAVSAKNPAFLKAPAFVQSMAKIVLNPKNYRTLAELKTRATLIYGDEDQFIGAQNIPGVVEANAKYLTAIKTHGRHGVSRDKYAQMVGILEGVLHA